MAYDSRSDRIVLFSGSHGYPEGGFDDTWTYDIDTNIWTNMNPAARPPVQLGAMAYDSESDRVVLFGGDAYFLEGRFGDTWAYDFDTNTWTNMSPVLKPPGRIRHGMAYDAESDRVILFGGAGFGVQHDDTWAYDFNTNSWTEMKPSSAPSRRDYVAMAYDADSDLVVLFGGSSWELDSQLDDTWAYDFNTNTWTRMVGAVQPLARAGHALAYDSQSDLVVLFGGAMYNDTWAYDVDANVWTNMSPVMGPSYTTGHAVAYDSQSDRVVLASLDEIWAYDLDSNGWTRMDPEDKPSPRTGHAMSYDSQSDRIILFGGSRAGRGAWYDTWVYELETNTWVNMKPAVAPTRRLYHAMAYDSQSDRLILFGGASAEGAHGDTWAYDFDANVWTNMSPETGPSPRARHAMTYDSRSDRVVLFGGNSPPTEGANDTWAYDFDSNTWVQMSPSTAPPSVYEHAMAYDSESDRAILFGGWGTGIVARDTWAYDLDSDSWTALSPKTQPSAATAKVAYDAQSDRVVLFGGSRFDYLDETWTFDFNSNTWMDMSPATRPPGRLGHSLAYDSESDLVVLFGGERSWLLDDTGAYDFDTNAWTNMNSARAPPARSGHAMAYDSQSDKVILFGGSSPEGPFDDVWVYDFNTKLWSSKNPQAGSAQRSGHAMAYDVESDRVILFGGESTHAGGTNDTWAYDLDTNTWTNLNPVSRPSFRAGHAMAYDSQSDRVVLFGGWYSDGGPTIHGDTWAYDLNVNVWTSMESGPPARFGHSMAYDDQSDRIILFGGVSSKLDLLDDTWAYDFDTNTWTQMSPSTSPPARVGLATAYDTGSDRVLLFGGAKPPGELDDTWAYDLETDTWTNLSSKIKPPARSGHAITYDTESDRVVLFGGVGRGGVANNETWWYHDPNRPSAPRALDAIAGESKVTLAWQAPATDGDSPITAYRMYRGTSPGDETFLANIGYVHAFEDTGLTNGGTYYYQVSAVNAVGEGPRSNEVSATPVALTLAVAASPTSGVAPLTVSFTSTVHGGLPPYTFAWTFGDGGTSSFESPTYTYRTPGTYAATVAVSDSQGTHRSSTTSVVVVSPLSVDLSASPIRGDIPLVVSFSASPSGGTPPYSFLWDFGDGSTSTLQESSHTYPVAGTYTITLTVRDAVDRIATETTQITARPSILYGTGTGVPPWAVYAAVSVVAIALGGVFLWRRRRRTRMPP